MSTPEPKTTHKRKLLSPETLISSIGIMLVVTVLQRSIGFGRGVLFCRWLSPESLGHWEMAYSFLLLAAPVAVLGLPGSFGRYLVRFREQGRLRMFLRRTTAWTLGLGATAVGLIAWRADLFASIVFGDPDQAWLMTCVAGCLALVIMHHFFEAIFAGLQLFRVVSIMHFCQSMAFAGIGLTLVANWRPDAMSIVVGYASGCAISIVGVVAWTLLRVERPADTATDLAHREFWPPLMRFAIGVWIANLLSNVFAIVDRYMILHCGSFESSEALAMVGNYHTSNIVPVLLISIANLLVGAMIPHLSQDWEQGDRRRVSDRLNRVLQLTTGGMLAGGVGALLFCPLLFEFAFADKYASGLAVMPWTVAACVWFSLLLVAQTYAWCAEKTWAAAFPLAVGLISNVALNLIWLPTWGLQGAVAATAIATALALYSQLAINERLGMTRSYSTLLLAAAPALLVLGAVPAAAGVVAVGLIVGARWLNRRGALTAKVLS